MDDKCFNCGIDGTALYGFIICETCKKDLRLFSDNTINRHIALYTKQGYKKDVKAKLALLESSYIKKKIKLLDILDRV